MKNWHLNRRTFLRGAGGVAIGLPLLNAMLEKKLGAQTAAPIRRFLLWSENNGTVMKAWRPTGGVSDFKLGSLHGSLEPYRKQLLILSGLHNKSARDTKANAVHQGNAAIATGGYNSMGGVWGTEQQVLPAGQGITNPTYYSLDQRMCQEPQYRGALAARFLSYQFGVQVSDVPATSARVNYKYTATPSFIKDTRDGNKLIPQYEGAHVESNPQQAFKDLFGAFATGMVMQGGAGSADEQAAAAARKARKRASVLDYVKDSYSGLLLKVGTEDQRRLSEHLELIRKLELEVAAIPPDIANAASCKVPNGSGLPSGRPCKEEEQGTGKDGPKNIAGCTGDLFEPIGKAHMDLITLAFSCDLIRVSTMQWSMAGNRVGFGHIGAGGATHHDLAHAQDPKLEIIHTWYATMMANMLQKLQSVVEPDGGTLLDKTGILWVNELSTGATHSKEDMPLMLLGGGAGAWKPGRYLDFRTQDRSTSDLILGILHAYGIMDPRFGDIRGEAMGWLKGPLSLA